METISAGRPTNAGVSPPQCVTDVGRLGITQTSAVTGFRSAVDVERPLKSHSENVYECWEGSIPWNCETKCSTSWEENPLTLGSTIMADSGLPLFTANNSLVTDGSSLADSQGLDSVERSCELPTYPVQWCDLPPPGGNLTHGAGYGCPCVSHFRKDVEGNLARVGTGQVCHPPEDLHRWKASCSWTPQVRVDYSDHVVGPELSWELPDVVCHCVQ